MTRAVRPSRRWGWIGFVWATAFAVVHLYWALGGTAGLAESAGERLADGRPTWFVLAGLWGVALALLGTAALGVAMARAPSTGRRRFLSLLGAGVAAVLILRAVFVEVLLLTDAGYGEGAIDAGQRWWTLALWNPWFLLGGIGFALAALAVHRSRSHPAGA